MAHYEGETLKQRIEQGPLARLADDGTMTVRSLSRVLAGVEQVTGEFGEEGVQ